MKLEMSIYNIAEFIIVAGGLQGMIFGIFLLIKSKKSKSSQNLWLGIFVLIYSVIVLKGWLIGSELYLKLPDLLFFPLYCSLGIGPFFYFYINSLLRKDYRFTWKQKIHLLPVFIQFCYYVVYFLKPANEKLDYFNNHYLFSVLPIEDVLGIISMGIYFYLSYQVFKRYKQTFYNKNTEGKKNLVTWIKYFILYGYFMLLFWVILFLLDFFMFNYELSYFYYYPIYIFIISMIHWIIYKGFVSTSKIQTETFNKNTYNLPKTEVDFYLKKTIELMDEDNLYLKPKLSLQELAFEIGTNPKYLSQIINSELNLSFYDFVNGYRIKLAKNELVSIKNKNLTISAIGENCGFNSKSSFNLVFKKHTQLTPTEFIKQNS